MSGPITALTMPKWGIEMTEGTINAWRVTAGQTVAKGDPLLDVETDKIVNTVDAPTSGTLRRVTADVGDVRPVGSLLGVFAGADVTDGDIDDFVASFRGERVSFEPEQASQPAAVAATPASASRSSVAANAEPALSGDGGESRVSPIARRVAERLGVDLAQVRGTGRGGRISKEDVEAFAAARAADSSGDVQMGAAPASADVNPATRRRMSATRATIATRLLQSSQTIPHYRLATTVLAERLFSRKRDLAARAVEVSVNDLLLRAVALSLVRHRALNARLEDSDIVEYEHADIAIAVATDNGLITPVLRRANLKSLEDIARESAALSSRARTGTLTRADLEGGTFTISNLGMFGIERFDAIINPPQVAILAVGSALRSVVARDAGTTVARTMTLTLSADHRVIDGAVAAQFLATLRIVIESGDL